MRIIALKFFYDDILLVADLKARLSSPYQHLLHLTYKLSFTSSAFLIVVKLAGKSS